MRSITKGPEPDCLAGLRREAKQIEEASGKPPSAVDWATKDKECTQAIRDALVVEQGSLCAYCNARIRPEAYNLKTCQGGTKIEHFDSRSNASSRMFEWDNLLGVCGGEYRDPDSSCQHCDASKGSDPLMVHPASSSPPRPEQAFEFVSRPPDDAGGRSTQGVWIRARDPSCQSDIDRLNLNATHLVHNRLVAKQELQKKLAACSSEAKRRSLLRSRLKTATKPGPAGLPGYARVVAEYVRGKMTEKGMSP